MNKFNKFLRSKNGQLVIGLLVLLVLAAVVVSVLQGGPGGLTGAAGVPSPTYPMPSGGYTCLPTCAETDAKMFILAGSNQFSLSNTLIKVWIMVPGDQASFKLGIFDGDTSKAIDNTLQIAANGRFDYMKGNWDDAWDSDTTYTLYADPLADGSGQTVLASWLGNEVMLNNAWWETAINNNLQAMAPNGHYYYRLEATRPVEGRGGQAFKVRATGYLMTGQSEAWAVGLTGMMATPNDLRIIYPEVSADYKNLGSKSTYDGDWQLYFYIPNNVPRMEIWDGDFDRGDAANLDTDDLNTEGVPYWATSIAVDERAGNLGRPIDDNPYTAYRFSPSVIFEVIDPSGKPIYSNDDPSGTEEWEKFVISMEAGENPDLLVSAPVKAGMYNVHIKGLDLHNYVWLAVNYQICDSNGGCPPPPWVEGGCPRTIGYWKNNVKKIYIENKTKGVQESKASLDWALRNVALASPIFRSGINVNNPVAISDPVPLTPQEANAILQKTNGNSMLDRALQQNLATWLNMASGKIGPTTWVTINVPSGVYEGTLMGALLEAQDIILNGGDLERAKDIADLINNGKLNTDPEITLSCSSYNAVIPPNKQPPSHNKMPKAPKPQAPKATPGAGPTCTAGNAYAVENPTNNPFYSVKFEFVSGTEVKNGAYEIFKYTLPKDVVAAMTEMQVEVKAATEARIYELACDFTGAAGCGLPVGDDAYAVSFDGAADNGDDTYTLTFTVFVYSNHGLSHVSFSLPEGEAAGSLEGDYTAEACK